MVMKRVYNTSREGHFVPNGCKFHNDCLTCPYPDCIQGTKVSQRLRINQRNTDVLRSHQEGMNVKELAIQFNVSERTIFRVLR